MRHAAFLVPLMALAGCSTTPEQRSFAVAEVDTNLVKMHGQTVFVHGYVARCRNFDPCVLADSPRYWAAKDWLTVEYDDEFREMLAKARGYKVLIEAEVDASCSMPGTICVGTPGELKPKRLIRGY